MPVLLLHYGEPDAKDQFFKPEPRHRHRTRRIWDIKTNKEALVPNVCSNVVLFAHALLGCDTASRIHGIGKGIALKMMKTNEQLRDQAGVFHREDATKEEVIVAGQKAATLQCWLL